MLLDKKLILAWDVLSNALGTSPYESDSIDLDDIGIESRDDLNIFVFFRTQWDTHTAMTIDVVTATDGLLTSGVRVEDTLLSAVNLTSSPIVAGTLFRSRIPNRRVLGDITPDTARYLGIRLTYTGAGAADEYYSAWVGQNDSIDIGYKELS